EARSEHDADTLRVGQLLTAVTGAVALFLAGALFVSQTWPSLSESARTTVLGVLSAAIWLLGRVLSSRERWTRIGEVIQVAGMALAAFALVYSDNAWGEGSLGARVVGASALVIPIVLGPLAWKSSVGMVAAHTALSLVFAALFLDRALGLDFEAIVWVLDALLVVALGVLWLRVKDRWDRGVHRDLVALTTGLYAGLVLVFFTGAGVLDWDEGTIWAIDVWWLGMVGLTMWGAAHTPGDAERDVIETHMAACVLLGTFFIGFTGAEALSVPAEAWAIGAAAVGAAGLFWGLRVRNIPTVGASTLALIGVLWVYAMDQADAGVAAAAMAVTAILLFWVASRIRTVGPDGG
ncbi:MAG: hypothetical protein HKO98_07105, partial [Gemmatimonadetes bacterium]|nr:hypothetical protein [Gemmatimonadota bacterium]